MNIKQLMSNRPLLTIDDPSIYQENDEEGFLAVATAIATASILDPVSTTLYLIGSDSAHYIPYVYCRDEQWRIMPNPFSKGPTLPYPDADNIYKLNDNLVAIDNHLYALRKELSYWNLYQIAYSIDATEDFSTIVAALSPGEALIINFEGTFTYGGIQYKRGDVIVRLTTGEYVTIEGSTAGFYYPSLIEHASGSKTYKLTYSYYQGVEPSIDTASIPTSGTALANPAKEETFEVESGEPADSFIYGLKYTVDAAATGTDITFKIETWGSGTTTKIPPIIKIFTEEGEEIWTDFTCIEQAGTQYHLSVNSLPSNVVKYIYIK